MIIDKIYPCACIGVHFSVCNFPIIKFIDKKLLKYDKYLFNKSR